MESPLEVLSRAATMVQDNSGDTRLSSKELPTTKWRRDRRIRVSSEYHSPQSPVIKPLSESNLSNNGVGIGGETPLDMSVSTKPRTPPPPYREPLPGSTFATALAARPSVITQAPKREIISNRENKVDVVESISMIDPVIDEHFRRSLGADYMNIFGNKKNAMNKLTEISPLVNNSNQETNNNPSPTIPQPSMPIVKATKPIIPNKVITKPLSPLTPPAKTTPITTTSKTTTTPTTTATINTTINSDTVAMSVDDHFAKALGNDTWNKLQADSRNDGNSNTSSNSRQQSDVGSVNGTCMKNGSSLEAV